MKTFAAALVTCCLLPIVANAGFVVPGLSITKLAPTLPGGSTTSQCVAINPVTGESWWCTGNVLWREDGQGGWRDPESLGEVTSTLVFDDKGRLYRNVYNSGDIYRREDGGAWEYFASGPIRPNDMHFDANGTLVAIGNADPTGRGGQAWYFTDEGTAVVFGQSSGESFEFNSQGDLVIPHYDGTGIDLLARDGTLTTIFSWPDVVDQNGNVDFTKPFAGLFESFAITPEGNYLIGQNTNDGDRAENLSALLRVDAITGERFLLGTDLEDSLPVDLQYKSDGDVLYTGWGSLHAAEMTGDFDQNFAAVSEPPAAIAMLLLGSLVAWRFTRNGPTVDRSVRMGKR